MQVTSVFDVVISRGGPISDAHISASCSVSYFCDDPDVIACVNADAQRAAFLTNYFHLTTEEQGVRLVAGLQNVNGHVSFDPWVGAPGSLLSWAISAGRLKVAAALLNRGADPLAADASGKLLLNHAVAKAVFRTKGDTPAIVLDGLRLALDKATNGNRDPLPAAPPLDAMLAHRNGGFDIALLKLLMEYGADPMYGPVGGNRALPIAIIRGQVEVARILVTGKKRVLAEHAADADQIAFQYLFLKDKIPQAEAMRTVGVDFLRYRYALRSVLERSQSSEKLEYLLKAGIDPNVADTAGADPPVFLATHDAAKLRLMLKYGADPNARSLTGYTLLASLVLSGRHRIDEVRLLLDAGVNPNASHGGRGDWGVLGVTKRDDREVIELLIARGATLTERASTRRFIGASQNPQDTAPSGPLTIALGMEREDLALAILNRDKKVDPDDSRALSKAAQRGARDLVTALVAAGANVNAEDERGVSAIAAAARRRDEPMLKLLTEAGAKPAARTVAPRPAVPIRKAFMQEAAREIDDAALFDGSRIARRGTFDQPAPLAFYGNAFNQFETIQCEHAANFHVFASSSSAGAIVAGVCERNVQEVGKLLLKLPPAMETVLESLSKDGSATKADLVRAGLVYTKTTTPNAAEVHYFPVVFFGHGVIAAYTAVVLPRDGKTAVIVQADVSRLCGSGEMPAQTPICGDTRKTLTDIALRIEARFAAEAR